MSNLADPNTQFDSADSPESAESAFDLRVVAGLHAGARINAPAMHVLIVGHGQECDVVLQDPALASGNLEIQLLRDSEGVVCGWAAKRADKKGNNDADPAADDDTEDEGTNTKRPDEVIGLGEIVRWAGLGLTIAAKDSPWPSIDIMQEATIASDTAHTSDVEVASGSDEARLRMHHDLFSDGTEEAGFGSFGASLHDIPNANEDGEHFSSTDTSPNGAMNADAESVSRTAASARISGNSAEPTKPTKGVVSRMRFMMSRIPVAVPAALFSLLIVFGLGMLLIHILNGGGRHNVPIKHAPVLANQSLAPVTKLIEQLGLSSVLHAKNTADGQVTVVGWVADDDARNRLASALAQLSPMPGMLVSSDAESVSTAQQIALEYGVYIDVITLGGGRLKISGLVEHPRTAAQLEAEIRSQLPTVTLIDVNLLDREQMLQALQTRVNDAGMQSLSVSWSDSGMQISPTSANENAHKNAREFAHESTHETAKGKQRVNERNVAPISGDKLYAVIQAFKQEYGSRLPIFAHLGNGAPFLPSALPFAIASITGGPLPSIQVYDDRSGANGQTRLLPGGVYRGYRLVSITDQQVVFDGPQQVVITR